MPERPHIGGRRQEAHVLVTDDGTGPGTSAPAIRLRGLRKEFSGRPPVVAVDDADLSIASGEFFSMLGPSGSGKTTVLRMIAGFEQPDVAASIELAGEDVTGRPPYARDVNTVFQDYAIFPHMSVQQNVEYGLLVKKVGKAERRKRAHEALEQVRLGDLGDRRPHQLSGGQRQRVALARALVNRPKVLLLDEPLGALDLKLREQMQVELKEIQREVGITFLFVTHDQDEALTLSDRIAVFNEGRIEQVGTAREIYEQPANAFVAGFVGTSNLLRGEQAERATGRRGTFGIRPEKLTIAAPGRAARRRRRLRGRHRRRGRVRRPGDPLRRRPRRRRTADRAGGERPPRQPRRAAARGPGGAALAPRAPDRGPRATARPTAPMTHPPHKGVPSENDHEARRRARRAPSWPCRAVGPTAGPRTRSGARAGSPRPTSSRSTSSATPEGEVSVLAWPGYVEDGSNDPEVDWISDFEKESGCKVTVKTFGTSDEAVQLMRTGQYDVVSASGDATLRMIAAGDVEPMNTDLITNYKDIFDSLKDQPWNSVEGQMYGVPHGRGANLLMYRTDQVKPAPTRGRRSSTTRRSTPAR